MKKFEFNRGILTIDGFKFKLNEEDVNQISDLISDIILRRYCKDITDREVIDVETQRKLQLKVVDLVLSDEDDAGQITFKKKCIRALVNHYNQRREHKEENELRIGDVVQFYSFDEVCNFGEVSKNLINGILSGLNLSLRMNIEQDENDHLYYRKKKNKNLLNSYI